MPRLDGNDDNNVLSLDLPLQEIISLPLGFKYLTCIITMDTTHFFSCVNFFVTGSGNVTKKGFEESASAS